MSTDMATALAAANDPPPGPAPVCYCPRCAAKLILNWFPWPLNGWAEPTGRGAYRQGDPCAACRAADAVKEADAAAKAKAAEEAANAAAAWADWQEQVPPLYRDALPENCPPARRLMQWYSGKRWALCLYGPAGTGKTFAAYALCNRQVREGGKADVWAVADLVAELQRRATIDDEPDMALALGHAGAWLVLDDIGAEKLTEFALAQLGRIIYHREQWGHRTIVTSNLGPEHWQGRGLGRLYSRFSGQTWIHMDGADRRNAKEPTP